MSLDPFSLAALGSFVVLASAAVAGCITAIIKSTQSSRCTRIRLGCFSCERDVPPDVPDPPDAPDPD